MIKNLSGVKLVQGIIKLVFLGDSSHRQKCAGELANLQGQSAQCLSTIHPSFQESGQAEQKAGLAKQEIPKFLTDLENSQADN